MPSFLNPSVIPKQLKKVKSKIAYLERQAIRMNHGERKQETRRKIQWGGLIKKAQLNDETTAVLYGMLLEAQEKLTGKQADTIRQHWRIKGDIALTLEKK